MTLRTPFGVAPALARRKEYKWKHHQYLKSRGIRNPYSFTKCLMLLFICEISGANMETPMKNLPHWTQLDGNNVIFHRKSHVRRHFYSR